MARTFFDRKQRETRKTSTPTVGEVSDKGLGEGTPTGGDVSDKRLGDGAPTGGEVSHKQETVAKPKVYADDQVCALLGIRKRVLVKMRKQKTRGVDWDIEGQEAGMTEAWIKSWRHDADMNRIAPIKPQNGIVTVEKTGTCLNNQTVICKRISDGKRVVVRVKDAMEIHIGDQFNAIRERDMLAYAPNMNRARY